MIGSTVSHYRILERLGQGGMGDVYLAEDTRLKRKVALKFLSPALWNEPEAQQRLIREARAASQLDHPNIVTIYGIEESEGRPFIHMAHVRGVPLNEYCATERRSTAEIVDLVVQVADGLQHAHEAGIVHRDLKPSNILVDDRGRARILDFGIASLQGAVRLTQTGLTMGTLAYTAPEVVRGQEATPRSDIYSLGVVMYELLSGRLPHEADHEAALLYSIVSDAPKPMSAHRADVSIEMQRIVTRCLEKLPERRYPSGAALIDDLKRGRPATAAGRATADGAEKPSIAVLPFANMSADPENEYFSDGLSEELLNVLAKNPRLKVTGRTSSFAFKGQSQDLREIGQKLGVSTLLEGSVRKSGNRVRITAQLIKAADGFHLWTETYDRVLDDIFAVQDDIARSVSSALQVTLLGKPAAAPRGDAETYTLILKARHLASQASAEAVEKAVELYRKVIEIAPGSAQAWAGIAQAYMIQGWYGHRKLSELGWSAKEAAQKALALDDSLADAHEVMAYILLSFEFLWKEAAEAFRKARSLAPGAPGPLLGLSICEANSGRLDEARRLTRQAIELDPLAPNTHFNHGRIEMWSSHFDEARAAFAKTLELSPGFTSAHSLAGLTYVLQGHPTEAVVEIEKGASTGYKSYGLAIAYHALGRKRESKEALEMLIASGAEWGVQIATVHAFRGELDEAFEWLERSYELHDAGVMLTKMTPLLANLHADPRWQQFLSRVGLSP